MALDATAMYLWQAVLPVSIANAAVPENDRGYRRSVFSWLSRAMQRRLFDTEDSASASQVIESLGQIEWLAGAIMSSANFTIALRAALRYG